MYGTTTLHLLQKVTSTLGKELCEFQSKTYTTFDTFETPKEASARVRQATAHAETTKATAPPPLTYVSTVLSQAELAVMSSEFSAKSTSVTT